MNSDEERLEEMLRAVMEPDSAAPPDPNDEMSISDIMDGMLDEISDEDVMGDLPEMPDADLMGDLAGMPDEDLMGDLAGVSDEDLMGDLAGMPDADLTGDLPGMSDSGLADGMPEMAASGAADDLQGEKMETLPAVEESGPPETLMDMEEGGVLETASGMNEEEMLVDPLALLDMSEDEIDQVLGQESGEGGAVSGKAAPEITEDKELSDLLGSNNELADIQDMLSMPDGSEMTVDEGLADMPFGADVDLDSDSVKDLLGLTPEIEADLMEETGEETKKPSVPRVEEEPEKEPEKEDKAKGKKAKKGGKSADKTKEKKAGFGKKLAMFFFGPDDDDLDEDAEKTAAKDEQSEDAGKKGNAKAEKKKKDKKEKKKKPPKKEGPDPKKAAKEKQQKEKNAEKARKKAEKAEIAEKERRAAKKLPKKKVFVWVLFCASIAAGILLMNTVGMDTLHLTEARNAFYDKDYETAYQLLNGRSLEEEDQLLFMQSSAILHLKHAEEVYANHLKMGKPVTALEDLMKGVKKYQEIVQAGEQDLITPELTEQYQNILKLLLDNYNLSEEGALEINALKDDYEYSLQLEALVNGEVYQSQSEIEQQEEEEAEKYSDLEDILPEEEEYLNGIGD